MNHVIIPIYDEIWGTFSKTVTFCKTIIINYFFSYKMYWYVHVMRYNISVLSTNSSKYY